MRDLFKSLFLALTAGVLFGFTACVTDAGGKKDEGGSTSTLTEVSITVSANSMTATGSVALTAVPSPSDISADYTWSIESGSDYAALSATSGKTVTLTGTNTTSSNQSVKVKVIATGGSVTKSTDTTITVQAVSQTQTAELKSVSISGTTEIEATAEGTLTATPHYTGSLDTSSISYTWTITSGSTYASIEGKGAKATIKGKNTDSSAHEVTVKVTATYETTTKEKNCTVSVAAAGTHIENALTELTLDASASTVAPDGTVVLTPTATYTGSLNESDFTVSDWKITSGSDYASLKKPSTGAARSALVFTGDNTSILQAANTTTSSKSVTASVKVSYGGVEKTANCTVTVGAASVDSVSISGTTTLTAYNGTTTLNADVSKTGNPANITYNWEITDGSDYAEITAGASTAQITLTGTNETSSARTVTVKVTVSDGTNSVTNTQTVRVPKNPNNTTKPALFPEKGSTDAYADTQLVLTFTSTPTLVSGNSVTIYTSTGTLVDTINILPTSDESQIPQTGSSYTANVGNQQLVRVSGNSVYIQPHYNGSTSATVLSASTRYYVEIPAAAITTSGTLADGTAWDGFSGSSGWTFTTKSGPSISTSSAITVSNDTSSTDADFFSVYGALCAVGKKSSGTYEIDVAATEAPYYELISVQSSGANVVIKGQGSETYGSDVVIEYVNNVYMNNSTHTRAVFYYKGSGDLTLENITIKNLTERNTSYTADGKCAASEFQAEALTFYTSGNLAAYNCSFVSKQDTILLNSGRAWFYKSHIEGDVDFIWGSATAALFEECEIESILTEKSAYLTETRVGTVGASTVGKGYVFLNSTIKGNGGSNATYLSRLASSNAKSSPTKTTYDQVAFINSTFDSSAKVNSDLWVATDSKYPRFIEKDSSGNVNVGWKTYGNTGITPVTTEYAGEITSALYAMEYNGRYAILNRLYNVDFGAYQTVASASVWDLTSLEGEFNASTDSSKNNAFTEPDTSASTTIKWDFTAIASGTTYEGKTGTFAATAGTGTLYVDATSGKIATRGTDAQFNSGTIAYIPASVGDTISVTLYNGNYTLGSKTATSATTEITVAAGDLTTYNGVSCVALTATGSEYLYLISVVPGNGGSSGNTGTTIMWDASDYDAATLSENTTLGIMTVEATSDKTVKITSASATIDEVSFTNKLALGGAGSVGNYRTLKFTLSGQAAITVYAGKASETGRNLVLTDGSTTYGSQEMSTSANASYSYTYTGSGGTLYLYSSSKGIDVYGVKIVTGSLSVSSVTISGKTSVEVGSSITLTATPNVSTSSAYTWTVTGGTGSASGSSTTATLSLTGVTAGTVTVTASVDGVTSAAYTVTVKEAGTSPTISLSDTPTGYAGYGSPSYYAGSSTITINASDANAASTLMTYVKKGNYVIYINGMIDVTSGKLPDSWEDTGNALGSFISSYTNGTYTSWTAWRKAYAGACDKTSHYTTGQYTKKATNALVEGTNDETLDGYQTALAAAWKKLIQLPLASNTTIIGLTDESGIRGANISISGISNVMLRNLHLQDAFDPFPHHEYEDGWNAEYDCITIQNTNSYIWIDHCTFEDTISVGWEDFAGVKTGDSDAEIIAYPCNSRGTVTTTGYEMWQTYDGLCDIKGKTSNVTISYCVFQNHDKTMLIGSSDTEFGKENTVSDSGRTITLHHNKFYGCVQRLPMARLSYIHNFNNYYGVNSSNGYDQKAAVNARYGVYINSEYNYFDSGLKTSYNSDVSSAYLYYANDTGATASSTSLSKLTTSTTTPVFTVPYTYSDILDPAADVPDIVTENAGAGAWSVEE